MNIRELRRFVGLTQKEFAEKYDIPIGTLRRWEYGESQPAPYVIKLIARTIPMDFSCYEMIEDRNGKKYYYDQTAMMLYDSSGTKIEINEDLTGVKRENIGIYVAELFETYYEMMDRFNRDCEYDKKESIIWS